ncbi:hypothetical protein ACF0H5_021263 [Mactra antiquata]
MVFCRRGYSSKLNLWKECVEYRLYSLLFKLTFLILLSRLQNTYETSDHCRVIPVFFEHSHKTCDSVPLMHLTVSEPSSL